MANQVKVNFNEAFSGELIAPRGTSKIGSTEGTLAPYDMLLGALASCVHATYLGICRKKKVAYESITYDIEGIKKDEIPTTLKDVYVKVIIKNSENEKKTSSSMELAVKYCSIYQTLAKVADMHLDITHI
ncbi:OsmC family protein [Mycoplasmatota bacterium]|nr:OsmC family protein [Mycoplasmatota bacterium]